ncbi:hypothetical protein P154DRAFT_577863 [Amniculicola lignicola CBS 123094]|uniref:Uncharacterized protein n=1 Tax=Amniculicola lignicola CBS 123094 TaxID=1392246 RepID=A0A6A5WCI8_9PLEO|nr:hypothetical protein P154DRAFT_577863 [Amniculicola lignicola CBS 123094]
MPKATNLSLDCKATGLDPKGSEHRHGIEKRPTSRFLLQSVLAHLDSLEPYPSYPWTSLDRTWLDQRLYSLESDFTATNDFSPISSTMDIFSEENYQGPFAGLIIVGEVDFCTPLLQAEPFPWTPRFPRECEVYEIIHIGLEYKRKYISRFVPRQPPTETNAALSQQQSSGVPNLDVESLKLQVSKRSASPLASGSRKRALNVNDV